MLLLVPSSVMVTKCQLPSVTETDPLMAPLPLRYIPGTLPAATPVAEVSVRSATVFPVCHAPPVLLENIVAPCCVVLIQVAKVQRAAELMSMITDPISMDDPSPLNVAPFPNFPGCDRSTSPLMFPSIAVPPVPPLAVLPFS